MSVIEHPLVAPSLIPGTLYDQSRQVLKLPEVLRTAYASVLEAYGLIDVARASRESTSGGLTKEQSASHFAHAFDGSAARAMLAVLDPLQEITPVANAFISALSGNRLCLIDVPCGAGATSLAYLTCIAELREQGVLPREPLEVTLIGADISPYSRAYADAVSRDITPRLRRQAIFVETTLLHWDVLDDLLNTDLITCARERSTHPCTRLLTVSNFNAALQKEGKRVEALPRIGELFRHMSGAGHTAVWIEPQTNSSVTAGGLLPSLVAWARERWPRFARVFGAAEAEGVLKTQLHFVPAVKAGDRARVHLAVVRLDLGRS